MKVNSPTIKVVSASASYTNHFPNAKNIWYDSEFNEYFSKHQTVQLNLNRNFAFFDTKDNWLSGIHGSSRFARQCEGKEEGGNLCWSNGLDVMVNDEIFYSDHPGMERFRGSSVVIVGGGPTTREHNWNAVIDAKGIEHIWSMNYFFRDDTIRNHSKLSLVTLGNEVDFNDKLVTSFMEERKDVLIFQEPCYVKHDYNSFIAKHSDRIGWYHTRYCSKLGTAPRLIVLAIMSGVKDIYVVGFDGYTWDAKPAFARKDREDPSKREGFDIRIWKTGVVLFWEYIEELQQEYDFNIVNLGHGHEKNVSSIIDYIEPSDDIKELL